MLSKATRSLTGIRLTLITSLTLAVAACGGSGQTTPTPDGAKSPTTTATPGGNGEPSPSTGTRDDAPTLFRNLAGAHEAADGEVAYTLSTTGIGDSTMTLYAKGDNSRIDFTDPGGVTNIIRNADGAYICGGNQCFETPPDTSVDDVYAGLFEASAINAAAAAASDLETFDDQILGEDATCFTLAGHSLAHYGAGESTWCFAGDGLLLRAMFSGGGNESSVEATEVSRDVSDDDFNLPYGVGDVAQ